MISTLYAASSYSFQGYLSPTHFIIVNEVMYVQMRNIERASYGVKSLLARCEKPTGVDIVYGYDLGFAWSDELSIHVCL